MKSYKELEKQYTTAEIAESFVFPGPADKEEREELLDVFRKHRKKIKEEQSQETILTARLLQLKFQMEDYLKTEVYNKDFYFGFFLKEYISRLDKKYKDFADDIDVDPAELSQIINKHRIPGEKFIIRLEIHSNKSFPAVMWCKLLEKEKMYGIQHNHELRESEKKHVKQRLAITL